MSRDIQPLVSIIIRTKNEERWIASCLRGVFSQTYKNFEVIIVDNSSTDQTLKRAQEFSVKVVHIDKFIPGKAINEGIRASTGEYLVCLSGHCIPVNNQWLDHLVKDLADSGVAGVYGRQEPLSYSSDFDKRDLATVFGLDKKIQVKDPFFHNANSAFRRTVWEQFQFDEEVTNIEDRVWGQQVIAAGMKIVYEPEARVYHWHGIHQDLNPERARQVVRIMESLDGHLSISNHVNPADLNIVAIIPVRGKSRKISDSTLLDYSIRAASLASHINEVIVVTDDQETATLAREFGASTPFIRPQSLSESYIDVIDVLRYTLDELEVNSPALDLIVILEETYPFRTPEMLDMMIEYLIDKGLDTVIAARTENRGIWVESEGETSMLGDGFMPKQFKKTKAMVGMFGLGCVTHPMFLRQGGLFSGKVGIFEVEDPLCSIELNHGTSLELPGKIIDDWWKQELKSRAD